MKISNEPGIRISDAPGVLKEFLLRDAGVTFPDRFYILPGFTDVHVHLREPGFSYKETISSGTMAAAAGGFTNVITMPNLDPVPDSRENLKVQRDLIERDALIGVHPLGSITRGEKGRELSDIEELAPYVSGFSDDGVGVMDDGLMKDAMERIREAGSILVSHCEDTRYPKGSREAEYRQLERDLRLADITGCPYHMCHMSAAESVELIRDAKRNGLDITCETAPHYLLITDDEIEDDGRFKMNPPIKTKRDRKVLTEAIIDGTVDMIATDHAPHSMDEKSGGFKKSAYGIVGLETAFPVMYTGLVRSGDMSMKRLMELMVYEPGRRFGIDGGSMEERPTFTLWDLEEEYMVDPKNFFSKGRSTPFEGWKVYGKCMLTVKEGRIVYQRAE